MAPLFLLEEVQAVAVVRGRGFLSLGFMGRHEHAMYAQTCFQEQPWRTGSDALRWYKTRAMWLVAGRGSDFVGYCTRL